MFSINLILALITLHPCIRRSAWNFIRFLMFSDVSPYFESSALLWVNLYKPLSFRHHMCVLFFHIFYLSPLPIPCLKTMRMFSRRRFADIIGELNFRLWIFQHLGKMILNPPKFILLCSKKFVQLSDHPWFIFKEKA